MFKKSDLWKYFEKCQEINFAICRFCSKKIKTSGNTTNLKCHLEVMHKNALHNTLPLSKLKSPSQPQTNIPRSKRETTIETETETEVEVETVVASTTPGTRVSTSNSKSNLCEPSISKASLASTISIAYEDTYQEDPTSECGESSQSLDAFSSLGSKRQKTITETFSQLKSYAAGGRKYTKVTNAILFMICRDYQPINIVENEGFLHEKLLIN
jgi:hypothetical protein